MTLDHIGLHVALALRQQFRHVGEVVGLGLPPHSVELLLVGLASEVGSRVVDVCCCVDVDFDGLVC